jgi:subtilase family serine protease
MTPRRRTFRPAVDRLDDRVMLSVSPLSPAQVGQAYTENINFTVSGRTYRADGSGQTIAIVAAGLDPTILGDLQTFDRRFGLPDPNFRSVYFQGAQNHVTKGWCEETALDVEWAHAIAPGANILLVQAASVSGADMMTAVDWARRQPGVSVVSMSWGAAESSDNHSYDWYFTTPSGHTGVTFVAASGDTGAWTDASRTQVGVSWPAVVPTVLAVGGTSLNVDTRGNYLGESAWSGGGGGHSRYYLEPSYQRGVQNTGVRTVPDVACNADPFYSGVSIYDSNNGGWLTIGGTSASAPQWAGLIALANQGRALVGLSPLDGASQTLPTLYRFAADFHDIVSGSNGYRATAGYDLATGLGSPNAVRIAGDLAFHAVTSSVTYAAAPANAGVIGGASSASVHAGVLVTAAPPTSEAPQSADGTSALARLAPRGALPPARRIEALAAARGPAVVAMPPEAVTGHTAIRGRRELFDSALASLLSRDGFDPVVGNVRPSSDRDPRLQLVTS